jgi:phosphopantothenoylcysteine decarboxylase/phosphopantothenate--cysteine ligase
MVKNIDIACEFGKIKRPDQLSIGFALETENELKNATGKLDRKNFDMVVLNSMNDEKSGFGFDTNQISIIRKDFTRKTFALKPKKAVAEDVITEIVDCLMNQIVNC